MNKSKHLLITLICILLVSASSYAEAPKLKWELKPTGTKASLRGLSTPSDKTIWACGSDATVVRSEDGGESWIECAPSQFRDRDIEYRSIHAWDNQQACIATAGTPAAILSTVDGGRSWKIAYQSNSPGAFFDGLKFWDRSRGIAFSDPVDGRLLVLETNDGGASWRPVDAKLLPESLDNEAGFAASNSALAIGPGGAAWIGTGGAIADQARIYWRQDFDSPWRISTCPIPSSAAAGVFSIAVSDQLLVAAGGDYRAEADSPVTAVFSQDFGKNWSKMERQPTDFRSSVVHLQTSLRFSEPPVGARWIAVGPAGSDYSRDGLTWFAFSEHGFHVLSTSANQVFGVGANGRFARLKISEAE